MAADTQVPAPVAAPAPSVNGAGDEEDSAYVTPLVRKLAAENNVNLGALTGTGVGLPDLGRDVGGRARRRGRGDRGRDEGQRAKGGRGGCGEGDRA